MSQVQRFNLLAGQTSEDDFNLGSIPTEVVLWNKMQLQDKNVNPHISIETLHDEFQSSVSYLCDHLFHHWV